MAVTVVGEVSRTSSGSTMVVSNAGSALVGGHLIAIAGWNDNTVTGTVSNTDSDTFAEDDIATNGANVRVAIYSAKVAGTFSNGESVTITLSGNVSRGGMIVYHVDDLDTTTWMHENGRATGSSTTPSASLDATTTEANTLTVGGGFIVSDGSLGWTPSGTGGDVVDAGNRSAISSWRYRTANGTHSEGGTADATGNWAFVVVAYKQAAGGGAFSIDAQPGSFSVLGAQNTSPVSGRMLSGDPGVFNLTGIDAGLLAARVLEASPGSFAITGIAAELVYDAATGAFELNAETGVFNLSGTDASVVAGRSISAEPASFLLAGVDAATLVARVLEAAPGSYTLTGVEAQLLAERMLEALPGSFIAPGTQTNLVYSGEAVATPSGRIVLHIRFGPYT